MVNATRQSEQDFIIAHVGGSLVPNSTHRPQDIVVGLLAGLRTLRDEASAALRANLSGEISDLLAALAVEWSDVLNAFGEPTDAVLVQAHALVGDPDAIAALDLDDVVMYLVDTWNDVLDRSGLTLTTDDGYGIYASDEDDEDIWS